MLVDYHLDFGEKGAAAGLRYLPKPVKPAALKRLLKELLGGR